MEKILIHIEEKKLAYLKKLITSKLIDLQVEMNECTELLTSLSPEKEIYRINKPKVNKKTQQCQIKKPVKGLSIEALDAIADSHKPYKEYGK